MESGVRLIRQSDIEAFVHTMEGFQQELTGAVTELNDVYDQLKADARRRLGRLYSPGDYPADLRNLFGVEWDFPSIEPPSYLQRLSPDIYEQEQARVARRFEEAVTLAEQAFIGELAKLVSHLTERLSGTDDGQRKIFRDTAIVNLREFFGRFSQLSVRSNSQLDQLVADAQRIVEGVGPQDLRTNDGLRQHVATELSRVQAQLDGLLMDQPRRRIIRSQAPSNGGDDDITH